MPERITGDYWYFYEGGRDERLLKCVVDVDDLAKDCIGGASLREVCADAAKKSAVPLERGKHKRVWLEEYDGEISRAGGDKELAYDAYMRGRIDELAYSLETDVRDALPMPEWAEGAQDDDEDGDDEDEDEDPA